MPGNAWNLIRKTDIELITGSILIRLHRHPMRRWVSVAYFTVGLVLSIPTTEPETVVPNTDHLAKSASPQANTATLVHVHAIWRHGDRTPIVVIPTDEANDATSWVEGLGELTSKGIKQEYRLGKWMRDRYGAFLGQRYSPAEVYIRSSDYNRTLMSAQVVLAALFPPSKEQHLDSDLHWQPIPVHTVAKDHDPVLYESILCPEAKAAVNRIYEENELALMVERQNADMLKYIGKNMGSTAPRFRLADMWSVFDPLNAVMSHNDTHKMPSWANASVWREIVRLYDISCQLYFFDRKVKRLRGGPLLKEVVDRVKRKAKDENATHEKFFAYSAHDMTIGSFLSVLGIRPSVFPLYSSLVLLELHRNNRGFEVKLFYKNVTDSPELYEFPIGDCVDQDPCYVERFIERSLRYIPGDWKGECGIAECNADTTNIYIGVIVALSVIVGLLGSVLMLGVINRIVERCQRYEGRVRLPTSDQSCDNFT